MWRVDSLEKALMLGKNEGRRRGPQKMTWLYSITNVMDMSLSKLRELVIPSNHLILCCSLLLPPSIFPNISIFSNESVLCIRWSVYWSFSISPSNEYWFPLGLTGLEAPCCPRDAQESSSTPQFKSINSSALSFLYSPTPEFRQNVVHWRREWQTTSIFLLWEPHEQHEKAKR